MDPRDLLTEDGRAVLLLSSPLGLAETGGGSDVAPLTLSEWNQLAKLIHASPYQRPAGLLGQTAAALTATLGCDPATAERIVQLLDRGGRVALENLAGRGMWVVTRIDPGYPAKLRDKLRHQAPPVLFGAGSLELFQQKSIAIVGSRNIDEAGTMFAQALGRKCAAEGLLVVSGGARGTDSLAMNASVEGGGAVAGVLADSLERTIRQPELRQLLIDGRLVLVTPYTPTAGFSVGGAMGRNKVIYGLADYAVVVSSEFQKGGTWAGASEAIKAGWCPVYVRQGAVLPTGNRELLKMTTTALTDAELESTGDLEAWFQARVPKRAKQGELLPMEVLERPASYRSRRSTRH